MFHLIYLDMKTEAIKMKKKKNGSFVYRILKHNILHFYGFFKIIS